MFALSEINVDIVAEIKTTKINKQILKGGSNKCGHRFKEKINTFSGVKQIIIINFQLLWP